MDGKRFDGLSRVLGRGITRRGAVKAALGAMVGGAVGVGLDVGADAASRCSLGGYQCTRNGQCCTGTCLTGNNLPRTQRNRCKCEAGTTLCGARCVPLTSTRHCGACNRRCPRGTVCCNGQCVGLGTKDNCSDCGDRCALAEVFCATVSGASTCQACIPQGSSGCANDADCCSAPCADAVSIDEKNGVTIADLPPNVATCNSGTCQPNCVS